MRTMMMRIFVSLLQYNYLEMDLTVFFKFSN